MVAVVLTRLAVLFQVADGVQAVAFGVLRGAEDTVFRPDECRPRGRPQAADCESPRFWTRLVGDSGRQPAGSHVAGLADHHASMP